MASLRTGLLCRRAVCSMPRFPLERQFSLLRVSASAPTVQGASSCPTRVQTRRNSTLDGPEDGGLAGSSEIISSSDILALEGLSGNSEEDSSGSGSSGESPFSRSLGSFARPVPASPSYFSRQPDFNDSYLRLQKLFRQYGHLPTLPADQAERVAWRSLRDYRNTNGEEIKTPQYNRCIAIVKHLHRIHPSLKPAGLEAVLGEFKRDLNPFDNVIKQPNIDRFGRAIGVGRRKTSVARAWVVEGTGEMLVNGKSLSEMFGRVHDRESATWALRASERMDKYNVWALVDGGGTTGQAEALTLAVAKGLCAHEPALKTLLRKAGCITRDARTVERKKHGHVKARKMPAWVKR